MHRRPFDKAFAEGAGVGEIYGELRVAVGTLLSLQHLVRVPTPTRTGVEEHREWFVVYHCRFSLSCLVWQVLSHAEVQRGRERRGRDCLC